MAPVPSASGEKINWINYKTGVKAVRFTLELRDNEAEVAMNVNDAELFARSFVPLRPLFESLAGKDWTWEAGKILSRLTGRNMRRREEWHELIAFFKERLIALDAFWDAARDGLE